MSNLSEFHRKVLGVIPTPEQQRLYLNFPKFRGFSGEESDSDKFTATFIAGIGMTWNQDLQASLNRVQIMIPGSKEPWCYEQAQAIVDQVKARKDILSKHTLKLIMQALKCIGIGTRAIFQVREAPDYWVSFGLDTRQDVLPEWLKAGLLD